MTNSTHENKSLALKTRPLQTHFFTHGLTLVLLCTSLSSAAFASSSAPSPVMLPNVYHSDIALADFWVSEKFDGVRGYWDGEQLFTRSGERIETPAWFTAGWPKVPMDGELWVGRGQFLAAVSTIRHKMPNDDAWHALHFMVFDMPAHPSNFTERNTALSKMIAQIGQPWVRHVEQSKITDKAALQILLKRTVKQGGEGLVLHRGSSFYRAARSDDLLKLKPFDDAEAKVIAYVMGKGKYSAVVGALEVEMPDGLRMRLGSGLSDQDRRNPPVVGSWVTFRYNGLNEKTGIPRFARFLRVREDMVMAASNQ